MNMVAIATNMTINMIKHVFFFDIMNLTIHVVCTIVMVVLTVVVR